MAELGGTITIKTGEYRPCLVEGKKALFHRWSVKAEVVGESPLRGGHSAGQLMLTVGIVEFEDGTIREYCPHQIKFLDSRGLFSELAWDSKGESKFFKCNCGYEFRANSDNYLIERIGNRKMALANCPKCHSNVYEVTENEN